MKSMLRRLAISAVAVSMLIGSAQATVGARVTHDDLPVFNAPIYAQEQYAGYLNSGETVDVVEVRGDWAQITRNGRIGYTNVNYLTPIATASADDVYAERIPGYTTRSVTVYRGPSTSSGSVIALPWGTQVFVTGTNGGFCRVESASGAMSGYIQADYVSRTQPTCTTQYTTRQVAIYAQPSQSAAWLGTVPQGVGVRVIGVVGECCQVLSNDGMSCGYIYSGYLSATPVEAFEPSIGYANRNVYLYSAASTSSSVITGLPLGTGVMVIGVSGDFCRVTNASGSITGYIPSAYLSHTRPTGEEDSTSAIDALKARVEMVDWFDSARYVLQRGNYYTLINIRNGETIRVKYTTGTSHMDIEPATAEDTAKLRECLGGEWTYVRTPVILIAEGKYIAASIYGEPHGSTDTISGNNMDGVVCLHLTNSRTHGSDRVDEDHQAAIQAAYNWAHS